VSTPPAPSPTPTDPAPAPAPGDPPKDPAAEPKPPAADPALDTKANPFKAEEIKFSTADVTVNPEVAGEFVALVNELGLPRDQVAKLVALQEKTMAAASETGSRAWAEVQDKWASEVQADPDIGGQKWPEVQGKIGQLLDTYGNAELRQAFDLTGAGNNPHVVRFMSKVAAVLSESGYISGSPGGLGEKSAANILYPTQGKP
jgi:hypothetical protein